MNLTEESFKGYNRHLEAWKKTQAVVQINLKALAIILQKFLLFNVKDLPYDKGQMADRIIKSYQNSEEEAESDLLETCVEEFREELTPGNVESPPAESPLLSSLLINHPGTIDLFLHQQSNKILQLIRETAFEYDDFKTKHLKKMEKITEECEVTLNRSLNSNRCPDEDGVSPNFDRLQYLITTFYGISREIDGVSRFCVGLDLYPTEDQKIKNYLDFLENFKFFKI